MNMVAKAGNPIAPDQMIENRTFDEIAVGDSVSSVRILGQEAIELYVFRIAREAAALAGSRGGLDGFVFTAGIGEHAAPIRAAVCKRLAWLGVSMDPAANAAHAARISSTDSRVAVRVIPTDEEAMIARHTLETSEPTEYPARAPRL